jgi:hypothetical protein
MTHATGSTITANAARTGYTYVNTLVTGATAQGSYSVVVDGTYMDDTMVTGLTITYGYNVTTLTDNMGTYKRYRLSW